MDQLFIDRLWLVPVGVAVGAVGTLIGAGGGFVLVPFLLYAFPKESTQLISSISLAVVCVNGLSGSVAYARMGRIDYKSSIPFAIASIPGAILGARMTAYIPRHRFDLICGGFMILVAAFLMMYPEKPDGPGGVLHLRGVKRVVTERDGTRHEYVYNPIIGILLSVFVGFLSSLLGIGGGIVHVPAMVHLLDFPVHIATATSHFLVSIAALTGTLEHVHAGVFEQGGIRRVIALSLGVLIGAPLGARLSRRVHGTWIIRGLAAGMVCVGLRLLYRSMHD